MWHDIETNPPKSGMYYVVREDCNGENIYTRRLWCDGSWKRWNDFVGDWEYIAAEDEDIVAWSTELVPYEGEHDVKVIDFVDANNVDPSMRWHSVKHEGLPTDEEMVLVTIRHKGGNEVCEGFKYCRDLTKYVDMRYKNGKDFVMKHKNGAWYSYHSDGFWEYWSDGVGYEIVAWMPYPDAYRGE